MKPLMKAIRTAHLQKHNWRRTMQEFLLHYRATPHTTTQVPPATLMFGRNTRTRLPQVDTKTDRSANDQHVEQRDKDQRQRMKEYNILQWRKVMLRTALIKLLILSAIV